MIVVLLHSGPREKRITLWFKKLVFYMNRLSIIKSTRIFLTALAIIWATGCRDGEEEPQFDQNTESAVLQEAEAGSIFQSIESLAKSGMIYNETPDARTTIDRELACIGSAEFSGETVDGVLILTFDGDCNEASGRNLSGSMQFTFNGRWYLPDARITVTLQDFYIDDVKVEGQLKYTNISTFSAIRFRTELVDGKVTWPDGANVARNHDRTITWDLSQGYDDMQFAITGTASGETREGVVYASEITEPLTVKLSCIYESSIYAPVSGLAELRLTNLPGKPVVQVDFGNGQCDTVIQAKLGMVVKEIDLRDYR